jgi:hypothetical protein
MRHDKEECYNYKRSATTGFQGKKIGEIYQRLNISIHKECFNERKAIKESDQISKR